MKPKRKQPTARLHRSLRATKADMQRWFATRAKRKTLSKVHDLAHVESVGVHARPLAEELALSRGFSKASAKRIGILAEASGEVHDIVRRATEKVPHGPKGARAILALRRRYPQAFGEFTIKELEILADATKVHETEFAEFDKAIKNFSPRKKIVARSVHIADKLFEASGYRVLERRAFFVGKERLEKDLVSFKGLYGEKAPLYAVAMESCMRLRAINVLADYPKGIQPIAKPLHTVQEKFYYGLLKYLGLNEKRLVQEMERVNFPKFDKLGAKVKKEVARTASERAVQAVSPDTANSAAELVMHFNKAASPDAALETWQPRGNQAKVWLQGMKGARIGGKRYLQKMQNQIHKALTK